MSGVGENIARVDGPAKLRGWAQFTADVEMPGMVYARCCAVPMLMHGFCESTLARQKSWQEWSRYLRAMISKK